METKDLKFLLKLLDYRDYRTRLSNFTKFSPKERDKICQDLDKDGLVDFTREITGVKIAPPGRALLKMDAQQLPISEKELKVLEKISKTSGIAPSQINFQIKGKRLSASERSTILQSFRDRGLIEVETKLKKNGGEVWLTERGQECLQKLHDYFQTLRKSTADKIDEIPITVQTPTKLTVGETSKPSDLEILQIIRDLDRELGTENYLPIFHLRQNLQPPLSRQELDRALYSLQRNDQIELSALQEVIAYTPEQIDAGIPQDIGGPLFFIIVN